ncbi:MAG: hypothetical protein FJW56_06880, partial [Actinobacteria bacterium]|nr:hypothetical protein [Actinomycetota bacterium]
MIIIRLLNKLNKLKNNVEHKQVKVKPVAIKAFALKLSEAKTAVLKPVLIKQVATKQAAAKSFKLLFLCILTACLFMSSFGCTRLMFLPGISSGYYIWKDSSEKIHVAWSMERNQAVFNGWVATDGVIAGFDGIGFADDDTVSLNSERNKLEFNAPIAQKELSQEIVLDVRDYSYLEFELKINDGYDLERTHVGEYLANPETAVFRIDK